MKIVALIARILLGLVFVVFGLNAFLRFIPGSDAIPPGLAGQFAIALNQSHYMQVVAALQIIGGVLLLVGIYVPLGLMVLGPILVNILLFHLLLFHTGFGMALIFAVLWALLFVHYRRHFAGIFAR